ncbi:hypothetical protein FSP39_001263 [Pinctada imbricata]|uniref:Uncharacterized protein n=1 Tax=Pinctada imbricata TaxID=66713 RepID=A0AA88XH86_PINIB|nr:hypothetical protein FSP39_001263 [Pinctada imbricata]
MGGGGRRQLEGGRREGEVIGGGRRERDRGEKERNVQAAERIFRKIVHPGLDSLRLVDRNGLPIQSPTCSLRQRSFVLSPRGVPTKVTSHMYSGRSSHIARYSDGFSRVGTPEYYGEDSLVMPSNFGTVKSAPQYGPSQYGMPQRSTPNRAFPSKASRNGYVPKSATVEREVNSSLEDKRFSQSAGSRNSRWTMSSQNLRLEKELSDVATSRTLKRNAEILSHRVDRMYFMSGNSMNLKPRYQVDDDELKQLRDLAKSRQSSTRQHRRPHFDDNFEIILEDDDEIYDDLARTVHPSIDSDGISLNNEKKPNDQEEAEPIGPCTSFEEKTTPPEVREITSPFIQSDSESENEIVPREIDNESEEDLNKCNEDDLKDDSEIEIQTPDEFLITKSSDNFSRIQISNEDGVLKGKSRVKETLVEPSIENLHVLGSDDRLRCVSPESGIESDESVEIESRDSRLSTFRSDGDSLKDKARPVSRIEILNANLDGAIVNILDILQYENNKPTTDNCMLNLWRNFPTRNRLKSTDDRKSSHVTEQLGKKMGLRKYIKVDKVRMYRKGCDMCGKSKTAAKSRQNVGKCLLQEFPVRKPSPTSLHQNPVECECRKSYPGVGPNLQIEGTPVPIYEIVNSYVDKEIKSKLL